MIMQYNEIKKYSLGQWDKTGYEISQHYNMGIKKIAVQGFSASQNTRTSTSLLTRQHRPLQAF